MSRRVLRQAAAAAIVAGLIGTTATHAAGTLRVVPIRDHFCTVAGPTCKRPEVAWIVDAPHSGTLSGEVRRRPLRRPRRGAFDRFGVVVLRVPAGQSRRSFTRLAGGRLISVGDYVARVRLDGRGPVVTVRFFVRPS